MKKKEWYAKVKADGYCKGIACDECPFSLERDSSICTNACRMLKVEGEPIDLSLVCQHIVAKLEKKWAKKAEKLKELGGGI